MQTSSFSSSPSSMWLLWAILWGLRTLMVSRWKPNEGAVNSRKNSETKHIDFVGLNAKWTFKMHSRLDLRQPSSGRCFSNVVHRLPTIESPGEIPKNANPWVLLSAYWVRIATGAAKGPAFSASILKRSRHTKWSSLSCGFEYCLHASRKETAYPYPRTPYHDTKNWHLYLGTSQVSWINKNKSEVNSWSS